MSDEVRPIKIFGAVLVIAGLVAFSAFIGPFLLDPSSTIYILGEREPHYLLFYFWVASTVFYLLTGVGVLYLTKWGYFLFKVFLFLLFLGFPIGTFISYKTLSYMKCHQIKRHFGFIER